MNQAIIRKPRALPWILNYMLMALNLATAMGLSSYLYYSQILNVTQFIDPQTGEYPGPWIAYIFLRKEFILIPTLLIAYMIYKEFKIKSFKKRVKRNLLVLAGIYLHFLFIGSIPFIFLY